MGSTRSWCSRLHEPAADAPGAADCSSYHFEFYAPEDLEIPRGRLEVTPSGRPKEIHLSDGRADGMGVEHCRARYVIGTSPQGVCEVAIDCNAAPGASGAALLDAQHRAWAIYVGYPSANPDRAQPFSRTHYNFAITIEGAFRRAVHAAGGR